MKQCFKCREVKDLSNFYKHSGMGDGHLNKCKTCAKKDVAKNRLDKIEYYRDYDNQRSKLPHRKELRNRVNEEYVSKYPERKKAVVAVNNAVRDGRLFKKPCEHCGAERVTGHHPDYSKPLEVVWLCQPCHKKEHKRIDNT